LVICREQTGRQPTDEAKQIAQDPLEVARKESLFGLTDGIKLEAIKHEET
jgi:hypothetical protein